MTDNFIDTIGADQVNQMSNNDFLPQTFHINITSDTVYGHKHQLIRTWQNQGMPT